MLRPFAYKAKKERGLKLGQEVQEKKGGKEILTWW